MRELDVPKTAWPVTRTVTAGRGAGSAEPRGAGAAKLPISAWPARVAWRQITGEPKAVLRRLKGALSAAGVDR